MKTDSTENSLVGSRTTEKHGDGGNEEIENSLDRKQKSILVIDTPTNCYECRLIYWGNIGGWRCKPTRALLDDANVKPDWCPLKNLPEPKDIGYPNDDYDVGFGDGWDACLKEIEK